ncbi:succinate dehydrogenase, cytochrome b556 subunit [Mariprofundus sp. NF]|uniref:succinate dehydrogenase, cytochrome b556 subunit n=1 Tax=Mariprofundus sp. NF TaxID=2608716 RepID=UPI0015A1CD86|nr:succinate dehydrogenase, cytochrome b556 subunit [Mariprofundus sp. NF]NWF39175.1 succinate dehydrogenase, cytochrome b556 subunit [Mariprofundus sp. NF]
MQHQLKKEERPLSPRLSIYRWHPTMIASLAHRASGVALVLFVPIYLWLLRGMTGSTEQFDNTLLWLHSGWGKLFLWLMGVALIYHFINGIRFLCIDTGWFESRAGLRNTAMAVIATAAVAAALLLLVLL